VAIAPVHLWQVELDVGAEEEARLHAELAADEVAKAAEFASAAARRRFVVARGTLRALLGDLLSRPPRSIQIEAGPSGKPRLADGERRLGFNVTHSGGLALICVAEGFEVGVDLEHLRPVPAAIAIARRRFAPAEARFVEEGAASDIDRRFLLCWTRKEALAKAIGAGLSFDLRSFSVPLDSTGGIVSLEGPDGGRTQRWQILDVPLGDGHLAALALPASAVDEDEGPLPEPRAPAPSERAATRIGLLGQPAP
jgi:4'-phosphopantetheinyl transferase